MRLHDHFDYHVRESPGSEFAFFAGESMDYEDAGRLVNRIAHGLMASGLSTGDRVAFLSKNCIEAALFFFGASKAGAVPVPLNYRLAPAEWAYIVNDSESRMLLARGELAPAIATVRDELKTVENCVSLDTELPGFTTWEAWLEGQPDTPPEREIDEGSDLYQMYTSGTTGRPKGAVLTHRAVTANCEQVGGALRMGRGDRYLVVAPIYHAAAAISCFATVRMGGSVYIQEDFDPSAVVDALSGERICAATLVPAMLQACLVAVPDVGERSYDDLRCMLYGASPIAEETLRRAIDVFGCDFIQGYGMTETTAAMTLLLPEDHERALREKPELLLSAGRPLPGTEVRIVDDEDRPVAPGEIGQIIGRGPQLMRGYWNLPEATEEALAKGWMHTGDAGRLDEEGFVFIQDRVKDMIVSGGENIYPREVEDALFQHPAVADAAVIGVPDEKFGEAVKAVIVLRANAQADADGIIEHCRTLLAGYKRPRSVDFIDELPRNPSGKVLKRVLRDPYWEGHGRRVAGS